MKEISCSSYFSFFLGIYGCLILAYSILLEKDVLLENPYYKKCGKLLPWGKALSIYMIALAVYLFSLNF